MSLRLFFSLFSLLYWTDSQAQVSNNLDFMANWDDNTLPVHGSGIAYNDVWGYVDSLGREYAIIGTLNGTFFLNVTDPYNPLLADYEPGKDTLDRGTHRDFKTYKQYAYAVSDDGNASLQIFDLSYLPDSVYKVYDSDSLSFRCHNIFIADDKLFLAANTTKTAYHPMDVLSLADPANPLFISTLTSPEFSIIHDVYVRNDTAYCSAGNDGLFIYDYTNPYSPVLLQSITSYPEKGFNHSSWVTSDGKTLIFADETHGMGLKLYDISDFSNITLKSIFRSNLLGINPPNDPSNGSIAHNPFVVGNDKVFVSYYHDGVQAFDISDPVNPVNVGYYDTEPLSTNYSGFSACWGVYPFLPSGTIIASDILNGLFLLDGTKILSGILPLQHDKDEVIVMPNPFQGTLTVSLVMRNSGEIHYEVFDIAGKRVVFDTISFLAGKTQVNVDMEGVAPGLYVLQLTGEQFSVMKKIIKTNQ